ncbi:hypothetical protein, partial [Chromobacterium piscinae]|uniref:hypothetical protein n=1 Tax=Chromobacterium piscinae TaxID=686831 RepID=UPI0032614DAC
VDAAGVEHRLSLVGVGHVQLAAVVQRIRRRDIGVFGDGALVVAGEGGGIVDAGDDDGYWTLALSTL